MNLTPREQKDKELFEEIKSQGPQQVSLGFWDQILRKDSE